MISDKDSDYVIEKGEELARATKSLGCELEDAFMPMGFLPLPVIPELKITDKGVFDTTKCQFIDIFDVMANV